MHLKMHESQFDAGSSEMSKNPASNTRTDETFDVYLNEGGTSETMTTIDTEQMI